MDNKIICIVGPTASGKTKLAINIAKEIDGEIICADSMQVYKKFNIATAKPTDEEIQSVPHHMFDFVEPSDNFSVAKYVKLANEFIFDIKSRNKTPIIVGGTGLYVDSLVRGNDFAKKVRDNDEIRKKYEKLALEKGNFVVHEILRDIDFESYNKLFPNDLKRVIRAIEVYEITGMTISEHNKKTKEVPDKYSATYFAINPTQREVLYDRINNRVDYMMDIGLLAEAESVLSDDKINKTALGAIGYKELRAYFDGSATLATCVDKIKQESRRYAKRQLTWFKRNEKINWFSEINSEKDMLQKALHILKEDFYE